ncbi:hypothetical protein B0J13DRAFT_558518 [Dactylonectria estremocensis]|uniref:Uncharacterized protein n=1 Tax=Dactylonectria estremocensis TaxID=1079267 RepID=A0A9P9EMI0_9HYPO|nr:hypothetical protein B0J13DRAFT_558518 [Dactylonectria estremocensis]
MSSTSLQVPFPPSCALNRDRLCLPSSIPSQSHSDQEANHIHYLPGYPAVSLAPDEIYTHLTHELDTPLLDELHANLWLVGKRSGDHIDTLHTQRVKGRTVVPTEDPRLHLIWDRNKVYIKPVPIFLLNYDVWSTYLLSNEPKPYAKSHKDSLKSTTASFDCSTAVGFMRSYSFLVSHPLDLAIAQELYLIPHHIDWVQWSGFICHFRHIRDENVARRYHYGQLRLSRLNWVVRIVRPRHAHSVWFYELPHWSISEFVAKYTLPLAFIFATISLALSSMQVALSVPADALWFKESSDRLQGMYRAFWVFSIVVLLLWVIVWLLLLSIPLLALAWQLLWGYSNRDKPNRQVITMA